MSTLQKKLNVSGYDFNAVYIPMDKVGGDFYDYFKNENSIDLFIADVSGHGLSGAFISMITKMALENIDDRSSAGRVHALLNDVILKSTINGNYVTSFFCKVDMSSNKLSFSNAGHFPPLVYRKAENKTFELNAKGTPLGCFEKINYGEDEIQLFPEDRLILYTDGITESMNPEKEMFGDERFRDFIEDNTELKPELFSQRLLEDLKNFTKSDSFDDDLTLVVFDVL